MSGTSYGATSDEKGHVIAPRWLGYVVTLALEALVTAGLLALQPYFPLGGFPISYVLLIMAVAYLFGEGPAVVAFVTGMLAFTYFFVLPDGLWPVAERTESWARLVAFLLGTAVVGFATSLIRRSNRRVRSFADQLTVAKQSADQRRTELEVILSSMAGGVIVVDTDLYVTYANATVERMVPLNRQVGQPLDAWVKMANVRRMNGTPLRMQEHPVNRAMLGQSIAEELYILNGQSGPNTVVGATAAPIRNPAGAITGAVVVIRDVTTHHKMQTRIDEQNALLDMFVRDVPIGLAFLDMEGRLSIANGAIAEMIGVSTEGAVGKRPSEVWHRDGGKLTEKAVDQVLATGEIITWNEFVFCRPEERFFDAEFIPVRRSDGEMIGVGIVAVEVTEQVKARGVLQTSYEREHKIAEALQTGLLGVVPERIGSFRFETIYRAAFEEIRIGGDFYDVFPVGDGKIGIVIGDVSGKGLRAAVQMAMAKYSLRGTACDSESPAAMLTLLNKAFAMDSEEDSFVTVFLGILDCTDRTLTYANGGHEPVLVWHDADRTITQLEPTGPIVGAIDFATYTENTITLQTGDEILLATDGLVEVKCKDGFLDLIGLINIYSAKMSQGQMSTEDLVSHIDDLRVTSMRDDTAVMRVIVG